MTRATVCVMTLIAVLPSDVWAQAAATRESSLDALEAGQRVRVRAADALSIEGVFLGLEGQDMLLSVTPAEQAQRIPVDRLEALWVRTRANKKGALIGAIAGGVLGIAAVIYLGPLADLSSSSEALGFRLGVPALFAGTGAVSGALIGYLVRGWSLAWP